MDLFMEINLNGNGGNKLEWIRNGFVYGNLFMEMEFVMGLFIYGYVAK